MADWIHKEVNYRFPKDLSTSSRTKHYLGYEMIDNFPRWTEKILGRRSETNQAEMKKWDKEAREIAEWWLTGAQLTLVGFLNLHCAEGWELFKISKDFQNTGDSWCIFRKKE